MTTIGASIIASENRTRKIIKMSREAGSYSKHGFRAMDDKTKQYLGNLLVGILLGIIVVMFFS